MFRERSEETLPFYLVRAELALYTNPATFKETCNKMENRDILKISKRTVRYDLT